MNISTCKNCGKQFLQNSTENHNYCRICNKNWRKEQERKEEEAQKLKWQEQRKRNQEIFEKEIYKYNPVSIEEINPSNRTLYIIGNGFDLIHRVPSTYYSFRDSLKGKNSNLRWLLETTLTPDDIWADFENSLGSLNLDLMASRDIVDMWLDDFGFYDEDSGAAEYYMAIEAAANPIISIVHDLQPAFRRWISRLNIGTDDRPLNKLISPKGRAISFNYTEFIESLYGVKDVCYIHGCRKNKREKLILGHRPGAEGVFHGKERKPCTYRQAVIDVAQDNVFELIGQYDENLTKNSQEIIASHRAFFDSLKDINQVIVIGHSLSPVDWDYFFEVDKAIPDAHWYFGIFGLNDLRNNDRLTKELGIKNYSIFRTDGIRTEPISAEDVTPKVKKHNQRTIQDEETTIIIKDNYDLIMDNFEIVLPDQVKKAAILGNHIFLILDDLGHSILQFSKQGDSWEFVAKLKSFEHQSLINKRLNHVFMTEDYLTFVYNNRVRIYELATGKMISNHQIRDAKNKRYDGTDVMKKILP